jgi:hypothetical protein
MYQNGRAGLQGKIAGGSAERLSRQNEESLFTTIKGD